MDAVIPATLVGPKVTFTGMEDPDAHLAAFHTQMLLVGGSDAVRCKLFMSTLAGTAMEWFMSLPDGHVTSFSQLTKLFKAQYLANRAPPVCFLRPLLCETVSRRVFEGVPLPFWGTCGEVEPHRRKDDGACV